MVEEISVEALVRGLRSGSGPSHGLEKYAAHLSKTRFDETKYRYELSDFLGYHDREFIRNVYLGLLRHEPSEEAYALYLDRLYRKRWSKIEIVGQVRYSGEGRSNGVVVNGLFRSYLIRKVLHLPVLGYLLSFFAILFSLPLIHRREMTEKYRRSAELAEQETTTAQEINTLSARLERMSVTKAESAEVTAALARKSEGADVAAMEARVQAALISKADRSELQGLSRKHLDINRSVSEMERRLLLLLEEARKRLPNPLSVEQLQHMVEESAHVLDPLYTNFEDRFRGTSAEIRERVSVYLPYVVRGSKAGLDVLDVGSGRGEWLALLTEADYRARGIDLNVNMVNVCREAGLDAIQGDASEYLRGLPADSIGTITGFHIIEHVPFDDMVRLFDEVLRVLVPGGIAIFETPNPENLIVGACNFYYDPSHRAPLPPEPTRMIMEARGFFPVEILRLHPYPEEERLMEGSERLREIINTKFFGPRDYALLARKA